jgi:hypothetical protein
VVVELVLLVEMERREHLEQVVLVFKLLLLDQQLIQRVSVH